MEELELFLFTRVNHRNRVAPRSRQQSSTYIIFPLSRKGFRKLQKKAGRMPGNGEHRCGGGERVPGEGLTWALTVFIKLPELGGHVGVCNNTLSLSTDPKYFTMRFF